MTEKLFSKPLVSVIIVVFNSGKVVNRAIESVLNQTYKSRELLIIDGNSNSETLSALEKYHSELDYFISENDNGIYDAMNKGIAAAKGEWLYFLGADDIIIDENVLKNIFDSSTNLNTDILYGNVRFRSNNKLFGGSRNYTQLIGKNISHQAIFYNKKIFEQMGYYNLRYKILSDYDFNLKIFENQNLRKAYIPMEICLYNDKGGASNIIIDSAFFSDWLNRFTRASGVSISKSSLQQYYFYSGFVSLFRDKELRGLLHCFQAFVSGPRKLFYILVFIKFALGYLGMGKKIRIV